MGYKYQIDEAEFRDKWNELGNTTSVAQYFNIPVSACNYYRSKYGLKIIVRHNLQQEIGKRYGSFTVLEYDHTNESGYAYYKCQCDCGTIEVRCLSEIKRKRNKHMCKNCIKKQVMNYCQYDYIGKTFNELTVLARDENIHGHNAHWICQCSCGNIISVATPRLGKQVSCGCKNSRGEYIINRYLNDLNIEYISQYSFDDCFNSITNKKYKFDFAVIENNQVKCCIEYNGRQHYVDEVAWPGFDFSQQKHRDAEKRQYCENHNIPLLEIPYTVADEDKIKQIVFSFIDNL